MFNKKPKTFEKTIDDLDKDIKMYKEMLSYMKKDFSDKMILEVRDTEYILNEITKCRDKLREELTLKDGKTYGFRIEDNNIIRFKVAFGDFIHIGNGLVIVPEGTKNGDFCKKYRNELINKCRVIETCFECGRPVLVR